MNRECPPIMICGFNRPDCLRLVFESVRKAQPKELFLVLDYPRKDHPEDVAGWVKCKQIFDEVNWPCTVHRNYSDYNMGCGKRMVSGISWTFEHVPEAVILEDDCVPNPSFYMFCGELLEKYKDDSRVGMIAGYAGHFHQNKVKTYGWSYFFDRTCTIWGWATWRRMWMKHDSQLTDWEFFRDSDVVSKNFFQRKRHFIAWKRNIQTIFEGKKNVWAAAWGLTMLKNHCLCIHPKRNMVMNVGAISSRADAGQLYALKRDRVRKHSHYGRETYEMQFPLTHPNTFLPNLANEFWYYEDIHSCAWWRKAHMFISRAWNKVLRVLNVMPEDV